MKLEQKNKEIIDQYEPHAYLRSSWESDYPVVQPGADQSFDLNNSRFLVKTSIYVVPISTHLDESMLLEKADYDQNNIFWKCLWFAAEVNSQNYLILNCLTIDGQKLIDHKDELTLFLKSSGLV